MKTIKGCVLVIDDSPTSLLAISKTIRKQYIELVVAQSGESGISKAKIHNPDLILLDIIMPEMDGFEVCKILKNDPVTQNIPIIFLTSRFDLDSIIKGFELGAVDYIVKGKNHAELMARINTHIQLKQYRVQLEEQNKQLKCLNSELKKLNIEKDEILGIAAHDLKNPINNIMMIANMISKEKSLTQDEIEDYAHDIALSSDRMLDLIKNLLDLNKIELGAYKINPSQINMEELLKFITNDLSVSAKRKNISLKYIAESKDIFINSDSNGMIQIFDNLLSNAIKYSPLGSEVCLKLSGNDEIATIEISDHGPGFTDEDKDKMFVKFARLSAQPTGGEYSTGLGLSIVQKVVQLLNGNIVVDSIPGQGSKFTIILPSL